jgi:hypothetical protein
MFHAIKQIIKKFVEYNTLKELFKKKKGNMKIIE